MVVVSDGVTTSNTDESQETGRPSVTPQDTRGQTLTIDHTGQSGVVDVEDMVEPAPVNAAVGSSRPVLGQAEIGRPSHQLPVEPVALRNPSQSMTTDSFEIRDDSEFDVSVAGYDLNVQSATEPAAVGPRAAVAVLQDLASSGSIYVNQPNASAAMEPAAAVVASVEIPAAMDEDILSWMYDDCCPTMQYVRAADLPNELSFVLMYVEVDDATFFWAALLHNDMVCCCFTFQFSKLANFTVRPNCCGICYVCLSVTCWGSMSMAKHVSFLFPMPTLVTGLVFFTPVCRNAYLHDISKTNAAGISKLNMEIFHDKSW